MKTNSLAFRLAMGALVWITGALTISGFMLAALFEDYAESGFERRILTLLESLIAVTEVDDKGRPVLKRAPGEPLFDRPYSGWYWEIKGPNGTILRSRSLWDQVLTVPPPKSKALRRIEVIGPQGQQLMVLERGITLPGSDAMFRFAVGGNLAQVDEESQPFDRALGWSLGILWFGLLVASVIQIRYGLRPLGHIREGLADIRKGRTERLEGNFPAEVTPLADELNAHLGHISAVVDRARTHVGNLAHSLKTPLSVLTNEAASASGPFAETVRRQAQVMGRRVDHHLVRARTAAMGDVLGARTAIGPVLEDLSRTLMRIHADRGIDVSFDVSRPMDFRGDRQDFEEMVGNLMDNACKWAASEVKVAADQRDGRLTITVDDDGPGLAPEERERALRRGGRLDESVPGTGLGLSIVEEIAGLYGGHFSLQDSPQSGLRAVLELPLAESLSA